MKCAKCGAELRVGSVYCENCGQPAQIVPDYNVLEDDFIVSILDEKKKEEEIPAKSQQEKKANQQEKTSNGKKGIKNKKVLIAGILVAIAAILLIVGLVVFNHSYGHYINKGLELDKKEAYSQAVVFYEKAIEKDDTKARAYVLAGDDYMEIEEYTKAEDRYKKAISLDKNNVSAYKGLVNLYIYLDDYDSIDELKTGVTNKKVLKVFESSVIAPPEFSVSGGKYEDDVELTLSSANGNEIFYSDDGSDPSKGNNGIKYSEPISLKEGETTIKAVCKTDKGDYGQVISEKYTIVYKIPEAPQIDPEGGVIKNPGTITMTVPEGSKIYYTWDGSVPSEASSVYTEPIPIIEGNNILSVLVVDKHGKKSDVTQYNYKYIP